MLKIAEYAKVINVTIFMNLIKSLIVKLIQIFVINLSAKVLVKKNNAMKV